MMGTTSPLVSKAGRSQLQNEDRDDKMSKAEKFGCALEQATNAPIVKNAYSGEASG